GSADQVKYGAEHYQRQTPDTSTIVNLLFAEYRVEGLTMPYTMADFRRDVARKYLKELTPQERLAGLPAEKLLEQLTPEQIEAYLRRLRQGSPASRKKKTK